MIDKELEIPLTMQSQLDIPMKSPDAEPDWEEGNDRARTYLNNILLHAPLPAQNLKRPLLRQRTDQETQVDEVRSMIQSPALLLREACRIKRRRQQISQQAHIQILRPVSRTRKHIRIPAWGVVSAPPCTVCAKGRDGIDGRAVGGGVARGRGAAKFLVEDAQHLEGCVEDFVA